MTYNEQKIQEEFRKMKATGIVRRIDDLGRVVIPKEIRKTLRIKEGTPLEIFTDREGQIILKKYSPIGELNTFAAEYAEALVQTTGLTACITDRDQVVAACGSGSRELEGKEISSDLDAVIAGRKGRMVSQDSRENISVISDAMDSFCQKMIQPILCATPPWRRHPYTRPRQQDSRHPGWPVSLFHVKHPVPAGPLRETGQAAPARRQL